MHWCSSFGAILSSAFHCGQMVSQVAPTKVHRATSQSNDTDLLIKKCFFPPESTRLTSNHLNALQWIDINLCQYFKSVGCAIFNFFLKDRSPFQQDFGLWNSPNRHFFLSPLLSKDKKKYLDIIHSYMEVHGTVHGTSTVHLPSYVKNHGILSGRDLQFLLRETKVRPPGCKISRMKKMTL